MAMFVLNLEFDQDRQRATSGLGTDDRHDLLDHTVLLQFPDAALDRRHGEANSLGNDLARDVGVSLKKRKNGSIDVIHRAMVSIGTEYPQQE